jgi:predicted ester cyclase
MVTAGTSLASGNDVRIARWNGSALDRTGPVDPSSSWNNASTRVWFKTQSAISAAIADTSYYLYYGYPSAGSPPVESKLPKRRAFEARKQPRGWRLAEVQPADANLPADHVTPQRRRNCPLSGAARRPRFNSKHQAPSVQQIRCWWPARRDPMSDSSRNKEVIRRLTEAFDVADERALRDLLADDFVAHGMPPGFSEDAAGMLQLSAHLKAGVPDLQTVIQDLVADGDKVVSRFTSRGTHKGEVFGVPPSDRTVTVTGIEIYRLVGGQVAEYWGEYNMTDLFGAPGPGG